jgi:hypothetical protein
VIQVYQGIKKCQGNTVQEASGSVRVWKEDDEKAR